MSLAIKHDDIPVTTTPDGVVVVTGTAEEIARQYPTVQFADVYTAITYYLRHRDEVDVYLEHRREQAKQVCAESERLLDSDGVRDRFLARMASHERDRVADQDPLAGSRTAGQVLTRPREIRRYDRGRHDDRVDHLQS